VRKLVTQRNDNITKLSLVNSEKTCSGCELTKGLSKEQIRELSKITSITESFERDDRIYRTGDNFKSIFVVQRGSIKTEAVTYDGRAVVTGFYLPGDLFGIEGIGDATRSCDAVALSDAWVCELPFHQLEELCHNNSVLQHNLISLLGRKIGRDDHTILMMHNMRAECRVSRFITIFHERLKSFYGEETKVITLPMTKDDIAKYLGFTPETLSRILTKLSNEGVIRNRSKTIEILDIQSLYRRAS
jgi:CRP/FNR family transcriptional regulator